MIRMMCKHDISILFRWFNHFGKIILEIPFGDRIFFWICDSLFHAASLGEHVKIKYDGPVRSVAFSMILFLFMTSSIGNIGPDMALSYHSIKYCIIG